jgi:hypothetical protein
VSWELDSFKFLKNRPTKKGSDNDKAGMPYIAYYPAEIYKQSWTSLEMRRKTKFMQLTLFFGLFIAATIHMTNGLDALKYYIIYYYAYYIHAADYLYEKHAKCSVTAEQTNLPVNEFKSWDHLISNHMTSSHNGWLISIPPVRHGLCNRILDITSMFVLSIATNRTLWVEWDEQATFHYNYIEEIGMSGFESLFNSTFHEARFRPPQNIIDEAQPIDECLLYRAANSPNLKEEFANQVAIKATRYDWWGGLVLHNQHYSNTMFNGLNFSTGFPVILRTLFNLRPPIPEPVECDWMIQYRFKLPAPAWNVQPIDDFLKCAIMGGMTVSNFRRTWIVTDDKSQLLQHASPEARRMMSLMNLPAYNESCRGPCGDRQALETMHTMRKCKNAVLTFGSSFGSCITSLAGITRIYRVGRYGDCHVLPGNGEPIDVNTKSRHGHTLTYFYS